MEESEGCLEEDQEEVLAPIWQACETSSPPSRTPPSPPRQVSVALGQEDEETQGSCLPQANSLQKARPPLGEDQACLLEASWPPPPPPPPLALPPKEVQVGLGKEEEESR